MKTKMPNTLILIRHGESELNVITRNCKKNKTEYPKLVKEIPDREFRLSPEGVKQAIATGEYLKIYHGLIDVVYCSDFIRARETAALVLKNAELTSLKVKVDPQLGERNWGNFADISLEDREKMIELKKKDPLHFPMPNGETILETRNRTRTFLDRLSRQHSEQNVLVFSHGEYIESIWSEIAHFRTETQRSFFKTSDGDIKNCQVVEFSSDSEGKLKYVKSSNPYFGYYGKKTKIESSDLSIDELLEEVNQYPHHLSE